MRMTFFASTLVVSALLLPLLWRSPYAILTVPSSIGGILIRKIFFNTARRSLTGVEAAVVESIGFEVIDLDKFCSPSDLIFFFEGNGCTQQMVGSHSLGAPNNDRSRTCPQENIQRKDCWDNDEARSLLLQEGFPPQSVIMVCDNPDNCSNDDFTVIETLKEIPLNSTYCVNSFEQTYRDEYVSVSYVKLTNSGSLDGKVSRVSACFYG
eukprot:TRINITY_DN1493_c0_g1_i1.p1 TRINITY_DN1493_c0_g1~~TRINITY_DN1493_c0_g1_i1.p1  ORF type:complete len:209 (-),score=14.76 TRINITY_DN1493_c0_g1_i1:296-922(-)